MLNSLPVGVVQQVMGRYANRGVTGASFRLGEVRTQTYRQGPYSWTCFLQVGLGAQVCVARLRDSDKMRVWSEARRSAKTGMRMTPSELEERAATNLTKIIETALESFAPHDELMEAL